MKIVWEKLQSNYLMPLVQRALQRLPFARRRLGRFLTSPVVIKRTMLSVLILTAGASVVSASSSLLESAIRHDQQMKYLSDQYDNISSNTTIVDWDLSQQPDGRQFTATDGAIIGNELTEAWHNLLLARRSGNPRFLEDHFEGPALSHAQDYMTGGLEGYQKGIVVLRQELKPRFFHLDGSVAELVSDNTLTVRYEVDEQADKIRFLTINRECPRLIMFLETIGWKISNHELDCVSELIDHHHKVEARKTIFPIKGINYYPSNSPWLDFWKNYDEKIIFQDLLKMHEMGVNTIRIFLPYEYFLDAETQAEAIGKFDRFLAITQSEDIDVIPTLFDFRNYYDPVEWALEYAYMRGIAEVIRKHDNVKLVDLKNEPDLDYKIHGRTKVDMWLITFSRLLNYLLPEVSVTIGWLDSERAADMSDIVDVVSYHEYGDPEHSAKVYERTKHRSGGKPVIISEIGQPSWTLFGGFPYSPKSQAEWLDKQFAALKDADGILVWTLHDFSYESVGRVAELPWRRAMQAHYGMIDRQGRDKPAVDVFKKYCLGNRLDVPSPHAGHDHSKWENWLNHHHEPPPMSYPNMKSTNPHPDANAENGADRSHHEIGVGPGKKVSVPKLLDSKSI